MNPDQIEAVNDGRPLVFRDATVLTVDTDGVREHCDVLVVGDRIEAVGPKLSVPDGTVEIAAAGGILMPGMVDTHRHMWQSALRGLGADWTLTQYFVFYYLSWGKIFRPRDIAAGNLLSGVEAVDAGVTTSVDWSHGLQTIEHGEAAVDALAASPGRSVLAYGNLLGAPWEWTNSAEFRAFAKQRIEAATDMLGFQLAFDVTGDPAFPEKAAFEAARELGLRVTTHAGVWGATNDDSIRLMWENGFMTPGRHLRPRRDPHRGLLPADRRDRRHRLGVDRERAERGSGLPTHLGPAPARHPGVAVDGHQRLVERRPVLRDARDAVGRPVAGTPGGACARRDRHPQRVARPGRRGMGDDRRRPRARPRRQDRLDHAGASRPISC